MNLRRVALIAVAALSLAPGIGQGAPAPPKAAPPSKPGAAKEPEPTGVFGEGQQLFKVGRWEEAIKALDRAVKENPHNLQAWYLLGLAHMQRRQWADAERCLLQVVAIDSRSYNAWVQLGDCAASQGQFERGRDFVRRILAYDQRSFYAYYALGVIDYREGRIGPAKANFDHSRALYEDFAPTWVNLAVCSYNQHLFQIALQQIRHAVIIEPKKASALFLMGWIATMANDLGTGNLAFRNLFDSDKRGTAYTDTARAFISLQGGNVAQAHTWLREALKKDPDLVKARVLEAMVLVKEGRKSEAITALQQTLELDPLDFDARDVLTHLGVTPPPYGPARLPGQPSKIVPAASPSAAPSPATAASPVPSPLPGATPAPSPSTSRKAPSRVPAGSPLPPPPPGVPRR